MMLIPSFAIRWLQFACKREKLNTRTICQIRSVNATWLLRTSVNEGIDYDMPSFRKSGDDQAQWLCIGVAGSTLDQVGKVTINTGVLVLL